MRQHVIHRAATFACTALAVVALGACGASGPTDPGPKEYQVQITLQTVASPAICEDVITGLDGGEFVWRVSVTGSDGRTKVLNQTPGFPDLSKFVTLQQDVPKVIDQMVTDTLPALPGTGYSVAVEVSEVDFDLFGNNPYPDSRMNDATAISRFAYDSLTGFQPGEHSTLVKTTAACQFRADYLVDVLPL